MSDSLGGGPIIGTDVAHVVASNKIPQGRSPGKIALARFRRDKAGMTALFTVVFFIVVAAAAPLISKVYGKDPYTLYGQEDASLLNEYGYPVLPGGGISSDFWFGLEPSLGRDVFMQLVYGIRTSLAVALSATLLTMFLAVIIGVWIGYAGGVTDFLGGRVLDVLLSIPSQIFFIAFMPVITSLLVDPGEDTSPLITGTSIVLVVSVLGFAAISRILRAQTMALRESDYVQAAKVSGASARRIIFKELLPNLWSPILVQGTLILPVFVTTEAALSFLGVGFDLRVPSWGTMFQTATTHYRNDITYLLFPGIALAIFVVAFNLLGDSARDAIDPKATH